jgi:hypothetical protein
MKRYYVYLLVFSFLLTLSCRKDFPEVDDPAKNNHTADFKTVFESFWNGMNNNYIFWDSDPTDWDEVYKHYQPLFANLNIKKKEDIQTAYLYFKEMTSTLIDCHFAITFNESLGLPIIHPSSERKQNSPNAHDPIDRNTYFYSVFPNYCNSGSLKNGSNLVISATIENTILYLYIAQFFLSEIYWSNYHNPPKQVLEDFFNTLKQSSDIKGIILDLRGNSGGYLADLNLLVGHLIDTKLNIGYTRCKIGDGRLDYSPWIPAYVTPQPNAKKVTAPIVVLADMYSVSMSEMTIIAIKSLPNGYFVGEQTWGAQGPLLDASVKFNSGSFEGQSFFQTVTTSSHAFKDNSGKQYENIGLTPDIEVKHNQQTINANKDIQLERAIDLIKNGK